MGQEWRDLDEVPEDTPVKVFETNSQGEIIHPLRGKRGEELIIINKGKRTADGRHRINIKTQEGATSYTISSRSNMIFRAV